MYAIVLLTLGYGQRYAAATEAQLLDHLNIATTLGNLIQTYNTQRSRTIGHHLRNIVIAQVEYLDGEVGCLREELTLGSIDINTYLVEQIDALLIETSLGLNSNSQHILLF